MKNNEKKLESNRPELDEWLLRSDEVCVQAEQELEELRTIIEQNGTELEPEQLVFGWFRNFMKRQKEV